MPRKAKTPEPQMEPVPEPVSPPKKRGRKPKVTIQKNDPDLITDPLPKKRGRKPKVDVLDIKEEEVKQAPRIALTNKVVNVKKERKENPWITHCQLVKKENPNLSYREVLKVAKESYKKTA